MGIFSHSIKNTKLNSGDHIYSWRYGYTYSHHGIYVDDGKVIHFTGSISDSIDLFGIIKLISRTPDSGNACRKCGDQSKKSGVISSCLDCFLNGGQLCKFQYGVSRFELMLKVRGNCTAAPSDPPKDVLLRAKFLLKHDAFGEYDVKKNNCEDFAMYCKTEITVDKSSAWQGRSSQVKFLMALAASAKKAKSSPVDVIGFGINFMNAIYKNDIGVRSDTQKVAVEDLSPKSAWRRSWWRLLFAPAPANVFAWF